jgi:hypothetical protein
MCRHYRWRPKCGKSFLAPDLDMPRLNPRFVLSGRLHLEPCHTPYLNNVAIHVSSDSGPPGIRKSTFCLCRSAIKILIT